MARITKAYSFALRVFARKSFSMWQKIGFYLTPNHFYEPIPDTRTLKDELWSNHSDMVGVEMNEQAQIGLLSEFSARFKGEYEKLPRFKTAISYQYYLQNGAFESADGEILYCVIRYFKPRRIIEIGSGNSTYLAAQAILKNREEDKYYESELVAVEPYPNDTLKAGFPGLSRLLSCKVEELPLSTFGELKMNDILFIDSSHVLKTGGDLQYEYCEILPRLTNGVLVHIHDIFLPSEYPREWVLKENRFYTEQYLLQAFLTFNSAFEVLWGGSYMHLKYPEKLEAAFSSYDRNKVWPGSLWMRRKD